MMAVAATEAGPSECSGRAVLVTGGRAGRATPCCSLARHRGIPRYRRRQPRQLLRDCAAPGVRSRGEHAKNLAFHKVINTAYVLSPSLNVGMLICFLLCKCVLLQYNI